MGQATAKQRNDAIMAAMAAITCTVIFSVIFVGMIFVIVDSSTKSTSNSITITADVKTEPFNVLLIGSNSREGTMMYNANSREVAATITLMNVDPTTHTIALVTVPYETVLTAKGKPISTTLSSGNPEDVVSAVEELTGAHVDYYFMNTCLQFMNLVDAVGGVRVNVPVTVSGDNPVNGKEVTVKAGDNQRLKGAQAFVLAQARSEYKSNADAHRQQNVRNMERAIIESVLDLEDIEEIKSVLAAVEDNAETNIDFNALGGTIVDFIGNSDAVTIYDCTGPYKREKRSSDDTWIVEPDKKAWAQIMELVDFNEDPSTVVPMPELKQ